MELLFVIISLSIAVLMVLFLRVVIDIKYEKEVVITITFSVFDLVLLPNESEEGKSSRGSKSKKTKRTITNKSEIFKSVLKILGHSTVKINRVVIPRLYYETIPLYPYQAESLFVSIISLFIAYLETKTLKLYKRTDSFNACSESDELAFEFSISLLMIFLLLQAFVLLGKSK